MVNMFEMLAIPRPSSEMSCATEPSRRSSAVGSCRVPSLFFIFITSIPFRDLMTISIFTANFPKNLTVLQLWMPVSRSKSVELFGTFNAVGEIDTLSLDPSSARRTCSRPEFRQLSNNWIWDCEITSWNSSLFSYDFWIKILNYWIITKVTFRENDWYNLSAKFTNWFGFYDCWLKYC